MNTHIVKNNLTFSFAALLFLATNPLTGQTESPWSVGLRVGIANYVTGSDFNDVIYTIEGSPYNRGNGNIAEPNVSPFFGLEVARQVGERWTISAVGQLQLYSGTLYEDNLTIFGVSSFLTEPVEFRSSAKNELTVVNLGLQARYRIINDQKIRGYLGFGLSYLYRSHYYRDYLEVDFSEARQTNSIVEGYTTAEKSALAIPVLARLEKDLSSNVFLSLTGQFTAFPNLEDYQVIGGLGVHFRL